VTTAEKYVSAAYLVVLAVVLLYVVIYSFKIARLGREVAELAELARKRSASGLPPARSSRARPTRVSRQ
jgi:hypothetical protein